MKTVFAITICVLWSLISFAGTNPVLAQFDQALSSLGESGKSKTEIETTHRKLATIAYNDLKRLGERVFNAKGAIDAKWVERLESFPASPLEVMVADASVPDFTKQVEIFGDEATPHFGAYLLYRCYLDRVVAVYYARKGGEHLDKAEIYAKRSSSYLTVMEKYMAVRIKELKLSTFMRDNVQQNNAFLAAIRAKQETHGQNAKRSVASSSSQRNSAGSDEVIRFKAHWKGKTSNFIVTKDNGGGPLSGTVLEVRDPDTGKKFVVHYATGLAKGLFETEESAVGATISIRFGDDGLPASIKNPANGRSTNAGSGWRIEGYGW